MPMKDRTTRFFRAIIRDLARASDSLIGAGRDIGCPSRMPSGTAAFARSDIKLETAAPGHRRDLLGPRSDVTTEEFVGMLRKMRECFSR